MLETEGADYVQRFTGTGSEYELLCTACKGASPAEISANLREAPEADVRRMEKDGCWEGILGQPEVRVRDSDLTFEHELVTLPGLDGLRILVVRPVDSVPDLWLALSSDWRLVRIDFASGTVRIGPPLPLGKIETDKPVALHVSRRGDFAAIVNTYGRHGVVVNASGQVTLHLDRGDYHEDVSSYSVAFVEWRGQTRVVHATDWNRLDVSTAESGELLTERSPTSYQQGEKRPEHDLDYFHCQLLISPDQQFVADSGWVWHPVGVISSWNVQSWLDGNVWESEDGPSKRSLAWRSYHWDGPMCWIDDRHLAIWGYGEDDEWLIPAACLFDVTTGEQTRWFPGPKGSMVFDAFLFTWDQEGTAVWDVATGERVAQDRGLCPAGYHPQSRRFLTALDEGRFRLSWLVDTPGHGPG